MENCIFCNSDYKKPYKSDQIKSIGHQENENQYYWKKCNLYMSLSCKDSHLNSNEHKSKKNKVWWGDCGKNISDKTRHFQSEKHILKSQNRQRETSFGTSGTEVEIIMNERTYIKLKINPDENLERNINELLSKSYFPRFKYQLSYLAKFSKIVIQSTQSAFGAFGNEEEEVFKRWIKSDLIYNHSNTASLASHEDHTIHSKLMQKIDDLQLEGSGFRFQEIEEVILEIYKVNDIKAFSWVELPLKYKNNKSFINIKNNDQYCFLWCILSYLYPVEDHKDRISKYDMYKHTLNIKGLEFPMKVKDKPKFERLNNLNTQSASGTGIPKALCINVFELN